MNVMYEKGKAPGSDQGLRKMREDVSVVITQLLTQACCYVKSKIGLTRGRFVLPFSGGMNLKEVGGHE